MTDQQTDDRQTKNLNPSVPYDTFTYSAGLITTATKLRIVQTVAQLRERKRENFGLFWFMYIFLKLILIKIIITIVILIKNTLILIITRKLY